MGGKDRGEAEGLRGLDPVQPIASDRTAQQRAAKRGIACKRVGNRERRHRALARIERREQPVDYLCPEERPGGVMDQDSVDAVHCLQTREHREPSGRTADDIGDLAHCIVQRLFLPSGNDDDDALDCWVAAQGVVAMREDRAAAERRILFGDRAAGAHAGPGGNDDRGGRVR